GFAEHAMWVSVNWRRCARIARDGDERPSALALPVRHPAAPLSVRQGAVTDGDELADRGMELHHHPAQESIARRTGALLAVEQAPRLAQRQGCAALEATGEQRLLHLRAAACTVRGP